MPKSIMVTGTDCYQLAAKHLNDASQFYRIMQQNGLTDPDISGEPQLIVIPDPDDTKTGGVPTQ